MFRPFWLLFLRLLGWRSRGDVPHHLDKYVIIVGPHTSNWDFVIGLAMRSKLKLTKARFLGKAELFKPPFGFFFRGLGGIPVDRFAHHNMVEQVAEAFRHERSLVLAMAPEGTRKKVERLRTGFYHIAKAAGVPIVMAGLDYGKKEVVISEPFDCSDDEVADFAHIHAFFGQFTGKIPEYGLSHLTDSTRAI